MRLRGFRTGRPPRKPANLGVEFGCGEYGNNGNLLPLWWHKNPPAEFSAGMRKPADASASLVTKAVPKLTSSNTGTRPGDAFSAAPDDDNADT